MEYSAASDSESTQKWPQLSLRVAGIDLIDCDHRTPAVCEAGFPYVAIPQLKEGRVDLEDARLISVDDFEDWTRKAKPQAHDVILSRRCNPGETAYVPEGKTFAVGQNLVLLRSKGTKVYPPFLRWLTRGPEWWDQIEKYLNYGAVFDSLKCADVPNIMLTIPPLPEQRRIAHVLGTLDDTIDLNRRMNATLEAMARALFRSWFVDFEPVRAKAEGREPAGMDATTAALFPDAFEESELGEIPKGWRFGSLKDIASNPRWGVKPGVAAGETPYIGLEHMPRRSVSIGEWGCAADIQSNKFAFREGEFLFGKLRPYFHKVGIAPIDGVCSTDILVVAPQKDIWSSFVLMTISSDEFVDYTSSASTGTKMPRTSWEIMTGYPIVLPPVDIVSSYETSIHAVITRIIQNIFESRTLAALRDSLLPKLISGEVRVPADFRLQAETIS